MAAAQLTGGDITTSQLRGLWPLEPVHRIERSVKRLVAAGRLAETEDTGRPTLGRGRSPRVYRVTGVTSDTSRTRVPGKTRAVNDSG